VPGRGLPVPALFIKFRKILVHGKGGWGEFLGFVVFFEYENKLLFMYKSDLILRWSISHILRLLTGGR